MSPGRFFVIRSPYTTYTTVNWKYSIIYKRLMIQKKEPGRMKPEITIRNQADAGIDVKL